MKVLPIGGRVYHFCGASSRLRGRVLRRDGPSGPSRPALVAATP